MKPIRTTSTSPSNGLQAEIEQLKKAHLIELKNKDQKRESEEAKLKQII